VSLAYADLLDALRTAVPEFGPAIEEHVARYEEPLPHVLFGDFTRFVLQAHQQGEQALVDRSLALLDGALRDGDEKVKNVVAVSFVENVGPWEESKQPFVRTWPPTLRREADRQRRA
jgi:hypothetical protein